MPNICMLANKLGDRTSLPGSFTVTEKLDGVRCIAVKRAGQVELLTRTGNPIPGQDHIRAAISALPTADLVLDGELLADPLPGETRQQSYERARVSARTGRSNLTYHIFDTLTISEFDAQHSRTPYSIRRQRLETISDSLNGCSAVHIVPVLYKGHSIDKAHQLMQQIKQQGGEGVMINIDTAPYEFRRSNSLLKLKAINDADLQIVDVQEGSGRNAGKLGALIVDYKGNRVGVGSGLTASLRKTIWQNPAAFIGRVAKVQYFEESIDESGSLSLRFPVFVELCDIDKAVSYA